MFYNIIKDTCKVLLSPPVISLVLSLIYQRDLPLSISKLLQLLSISNQCNAYNSFKIINQYKYLTNLFSAIFIFYKFLSPHLSFILCFFVSPNALSRCKSSHQSLQLIFLLGCQNQPYCSHLYPTNVDFHYKFYLTYLNISFLLLFFWFFFSESLIKS